jgi:hypothetical protein
LGTVQHADRHRGQLNPATIRTCGWLNRSSLTLSCVAR